MPRFKKRIVSAGVHLVSKADGGRKKETITPSRLRGWADTINALISHGHKVPAPWKHDHDAVPVQEGADGALDTSFDNGGFWDTADVEVDENNVPWLTAYVESPHEEKVGKTVKDTSIYVRPEWTDGTGREWADVPMHVAMVTHPIEPGQENFEEVKDGLAIAMSTLSQPMDESLQMLDPAKRVGESLPDVIAELQEVAGIALAEDTTVDNILERLTIALRQKRLSEQDDSRSAGSISSPPDGAVRQNVPIQMSETNEVKVEDSQEYKALEKQNEALLMSVTNTKKQSHEARIKALVESKRITEDYAAELKKALEGFKMSFDSEGNEIKSTVELQIETLEQASPVEQKINDLPQGTLMSNLPANHQIEEKPNELSTEDALEAAKSFLSKTA